MKDYNALISVSFDCNGDDLIEKKFDDYLKGRKLFKSKFVPGTWLGSFSSDKGENDVKGEVMSILQSAKNELHIKEVNVSLIVSEATVFEGHLES